ncbi:hypothetical protein CFOL_v3_09136, partial [Cephalotus follicularis]
WFDKYSKAQDMKNKLRQALEQSMPQIDRIQAQNLQLKKELDDAQAQAKIEKDGKENESVARISLEHEIFSLKSEISMLQQKGGSESKDRNEEVKLLQACVSEGEKEISRLKELLEKEKLRADSEKKHAEVEKNKGEKEIKKLKELLEQEKTRADSEKKSAEVEKKKATEAWKHVKAEVSKADEERRIASGEGKKAEEYKLQYEALKKEADEAKSMLVSERSKSIEITKELEAEKKKVIKERKRAELEMGKAENQKKLAEAFRENAAEEKSHAEELSRQFDDANGKIEKLQEEIQDLVSRNLAEEYKLHIEVLMKEANEAKSELVSERSKSVEITKRLEAEKKKVIKERKRAELELGKAEDQKKRAEAFRKKAAEEKSHAEELSRQFDDAKGKIEKLQKEIQDLVSTNLGEAPGDHTDRITKAEAVRIKKRFWVETSKRNMDESDSVLDFLNSEEANKRFEIEKQKAISEKKRADSEMVNAEGQRKLAEACRKKANEEKLRADRLSRQLAEDRRKIKELQKQMYELLCSKKHAGSHSISLDKDTDAETVNVKLLKNQLKIEKMQVKHVKQVAKLEKSRNSILQQELDGLKLEFVQFSNRLDALHKCFSTSSVGIDDLEKVGVPLKLFTHASMHVLFTDSLTSQAGNLVNIHRLKFQENLCSLEPCCENGLLNPWCMTGDHLRQTFQQTAPLLPISGVDCAESLSGIDSNLESLLGGSNRKLLQSSAINSSTKSFSDGQLVGSQERGSYALNRPAKLVEDLNVRQTMSSITGEVTKVRRNENLAVVAENSVRSALGVDVVGVNEHDKKRRIMIDAIKSIESLCSKDKKLHLQIEEKLSVLQDTLNKHTDEPLEEATFVVPNLHGDFYAKNARSNKKRKACHEEKSLHRLCDNYEPKKVGEVENKLQEDSGFFRQDSQPSNNITLTEQAWREALNVSVTGALETVESFDQVTDGNYMKLLDLDNTADEECYKKALEMPLSPTVPDIESQDIVEPLSFCQGLSKEKESSKASLHNNNNCLFDSLDILGNNGKSQTKGSVVELGKSDMSSSGDQGAKFLVSSEVGSAPHGIPKSCIVLSDIRDNSSILRIFSATTRMARCLVGTQTEWIMHKILLGLKMEGNLFPKEKVCVFFSLLLLNFPSADFEGSLKVLNVNLYPCLESFSGHMSAVISDVEARSMFAELCLDELFSLMEDFLIHGRMMVCTDECSPTLVEINTLLDGLNMRLSSEVASADQLVAGSIILASICKAIDHIGFICEASYNILRMCRHDTSVVLTILHVFAYLGGERYFTLKKHHLTVAVLKSIVTVLETGCLPVAAASCLSSLNKVQIEFHPCTKCPFSEDAAPIDNVVSLLLEKLQKYNQTRTMNQDLIGLVNMSNVLALSHKDSAERSLSQEEVGGILDVNCDASSCLNKFGMPATQSESVGDGTMCQLSDVLSVLELLACKMSWDWTCSAILPRLLKILESPVLGNVAIAVVILLGHIGRLGLDAGGNDDKGVRRLRRDLSTFLCRDATIRAGLPIQIATITALLQLIRVDFEEIIRSDVILPDNASQSLPTNVIRKWFFLLRKDQQALSFSLLKSIGVLNSEISQGC